MGLEAAMAWRRGQALGQDLRDRVLADAGRPAPAVAARFGVSVSSDRAWSPASCPLPRTAAHKADRRLSAELCR